MYIIFCDIPVHYCMLRYVWARQPKAGMLVLKRLWKCKNEMVYNGKTLYTFIITQYFHSIDFKRLKKMKNVKNRKFSLSILAYHYDGTKVLNLKQQTNGVKIHQNSLNSIQKSLRASSVITLLHSMTKTNLWAYF